MKPSWITAPLAALLCCLSVAAAPNQTTFTVGVENLRYFPLYTTSSGNDYSGFGRDVLDAFAAQHGYTFRYQPLPINRLFSAFLGEQVLDFKYPDNPNWQSGLRNGVTIAYSRPVVSSPEGALVLPAHKGRQFKQLRTLGTMLGFTPWPYLPAIETRTIRLMTATSFERLLGHAIDGEIDAVYMNIDVANHLLAESMNKPQALVFDPGLPYVRSEFSLSTIKHRNVIRQFDQFLLQQRPMLQQLRAKYKIGDPGPSQDRVQAVPATDRPHKP